MVDFPTPPLPDATIMTFFTPGIAHLRGRPLDLMESLNDEEDDDANLTERCGAIKVGSKLLIMVDILLHYRLLNYFKEWPKKPLVHYHVFFFVSVLFSNFESSHGSR